jgi:hypothetical protein
MFFYLSKIFWFFIQPLNLAIFLLLAGLFAAAFGRRRMAAGGTVLALLILALSAWTSLGAMMLNPLEERFPKPPLPERVDGIVVLGGGFEGAINLVRGGYELNSGGRRLRRHRRTVPGRRGRRHHRAAPADCPWRQRRSPDPREQVPQHL